MDVRFSVSADLTELRGEKTTFPEASKQPHELAELLCLVVQEGWNMVEPVDWRIGVNLAPYHIYIYIYRVSPSPHGSGFHVWTGFQGLPGLCATSSAPKLVWGFKVPSWVLELLCLQLKP